MTMMKLLVLQIPTMPMQFMVLLELSWKLW